METLYKINDKYSITKTGKIWSKTSNKFVKLSVNNSGYFTCYVGHKDSAHRLMAAVFLGATGNFVVNHKNGIKTDNSLENIEVISQSENVIHSRNKLRRKGKIFTIDDVIEIIKLKSTTNAKTKDIAVKYNTTRQSISAIFTGFQWKKGSYPEIDEARKMYPVKIRHKRFILNE